MFQHCAPASRYQMPSKQSASNWTRTQSSKVIPLCHGRGYLDYWVSAWTQPISHTFTYRVVIYKQKHGAAMGSPMSPIIANLYMEGFEEIALRTAPNPIRQCGLGTWTIHLTWSTTTTSMSSLPTSTAWTPTSSSQLSQSKMADCPS